MLQLFEVFQNGSRSMKSCIPMLERQSPQNTYYLFLTNTIFMTQHKGSHMFHGFFVTENQDIWWWRSSPTTIKIYIYIWQKIQHKIIFAFLLPKGTFVTWQMGRKRLLATSNESPMFENQIEKKCVGKKRNRFLWFVDNTLTYVVHKYERETNGSESKRPIALTCLFQIFIKFRFECHWKQKLWRW
jgi:hypothetical protein